MLSATSWKRLNVRPSHPETVSKSAGIFFRTRASKGVSLRSYFTAIVSLKTVADRHSLAAYHNELTSFPEVPMLMTLNDL